MHSLKPVLYNYEKDTSYSNEAFNVQFEKKMESYTQVSYLQTNNNDNNKQ